MSLKYVLEPRPSEKNGDGEHRKMRVERYSICHVESGGNFLDTANKYTNGTSEKFVGEFITPEREHFVLATKYSLSMRNGDPNASGNHRKNLIQSLEASLKRLKPIMSVCTGSMHGIT